MDLDPNPLDVHAPEDNTPPIDAPGAASGVMPGGTPEPPDDVTGLPGLRTWASVYLLVGVVFVVYVILLTTLSRVFA